MQRTEKILLHSSNLWYLGEGMLGPLFAVFTERIGGDVLDITWAWAVYLIVQGILTIWIGNLSDSRFTKEHILVFGYVLNTLFTFGYLFVGATAHLFVVQAGLGVAAALATPTWDALYAQYEDKKRAGHIWGMAGGLANLVTGFAIVVGGLIVSFYSFTLLFVIMGTVQAMATIYLAQLFHSRKQKVNSLHI